MSSHQLCQSAMDALVKKKKSSMNCYPTRVENTLLKSYSVKSPSRFPPKARLVLQIGRYAGLDFDR